jgi:hypothetical protein
VAALGALHCVVNNASLFDYDSATTSAWPAGRPHARQRRRPLLLAQALHAATPDGQQAGDQPAGPEAVQSQS